MEITNFLTQSFLSTFSGSLVAIEVMVFSTKNLPLIKKIPTRVYTFILALTHCIIMLILNGKFVVDLKIFYLTFLNALVMTIIVCSGYDIILGNIDVNLKNKLTEKDKE